MILRPIGKLRTPFATRADCPRNGRQPDPAPPCTAELLDEYVPALASLAGFSHLIVLYWLHEIAAAELVFTPPFDGVPRGIFATRAPMRPNPIGVSVVAFDGFAAANVLRLRWLDCIDATPLLDIKPYLPSTDSVPDAAMGWLAPHRDTLMARTTIIDTDPGTDDAIAIWLALASPELDVRLLSVVGGNVGLPATSRNARAIAALAASDVKVVEGSDRALLGPFVDAADVHGQDGLGGVALPPGPPASPGLACDAIRDLLRASPAASVTLVGIGPATNLALALVAEPALIDRVAEIVLMTGAIAEGNITPSAEFNAYCDPEALALLLSAGAPITLATLDLTNQALCEPRHVAAMRAAGPGRCVAATAAIWDGVAPSRRSGGRGHEQHDACAVAWLIAPDLFTHVSVHVAVDLAGPGRGRTIVDRWDRLGLPTNAKLLLTVDADGFFALLRDQSCSSSVSLTQQ